MKLSAVAKKNDEHPCFNREAAHQFGRIHLPIAPGCNIHCRYCSPDTSCVNENRPGAAYRLLTVPEALVTLEEALVKYPYLKVVGVAGPGDPLNSDHALDLFSEVKQKWPELMLCLSTNGLNLPQNVDRLLAAGISHLTVTINAVDPVIAAEIVKWVRVKGSDITMTGSEAGQKLVEAQLAGVALSVHNGLEVKVNSVLIPGVNDHHLEDIAKRIKQLGVNLMNIMPLIPQADFSCLEAPSQSDLSKMRIICSGHVKVMTHCKQCRADAVGLLDEKQRLEYPGLVSCRATKQL